MTSIQQRGLGTWPNILGNRQNKNLPLLSIRVGLPSGVKEVTIVSTSCQFPGVSVIIPTPFLNGADIIIHANEVLFSVSDEMSGSMGGQPGGHSHALRKADDQQEGTGWQGWSFQNWSLHVPLVTLKETTLKVEARKWQVGGYHSPPCYLCPIRVDEV